MRDLKARTFAPVYLLMGDEPYYIDQIADYIADNALQPEERDFNQSVVFGADTNTQQIADLCKGYPMMADHRVVIVKEAQNLKDWEPLDRYLDKPVPTTILVVCHKNGSMDRRKKTPAKAALAGVLFESKKLKDYRLPAFIENYLKTRKATIEPKATAMIAEHVGADLHRLISELDKLLITLPEDAAARRVTPDIVEREVGVSKEFNTFELRDAIISKNVYKANQIIHYFDSNPKAGSLFSMLPLLFQYFQNLMLAYYAPNKSEQGIAAYLDLKSTWGVKDYLTGMKNFTGVKVMQIIDKMRETDGKSKGIDNPHTDAGELMKELIFFILH